MKIMGSFTVTFQLFCLHTNRIHESGSLWNAIQVLNNTRPISKLTARYDRGMCGWNASKVFDTAPVLQANL